jgi:hypothetical protein
LDRGPEATALVTTLTILGRAREAAIPGPDLVVPVRPPFRDRWFSG